jgi:hypothetical protein
MGEAGSHRQEPEWERLVATSLQKNVDGITCEQSVQNRTQFCWGFL